MKFPIKREHRESPIEKCLRFIIVSCAVSIIAGTILAVVIIAIALASVALGKIWLGKKLRKLFVKVIIAIPGKTR